MNIRSESSRRLMIALVGFKPEEVVKAVRRLKPDRLILLASKETQAHAQDIFALCDDPLDSVPAVADKRNCAVLTVDDGNDLEACLRTMAPLAREVRNWHGEVVVDITFGTKPMAVALGIITSRLRCDFVYVAGERDALGNVKGGSEAPVQRQNPWQLLGFETVARAIELFNGGLYLVAREELKGFYSHLPAGEQKCRMESLQILAEGYGQWDRFEHAKAAERLAACLKRWEDFEQMFLARRATELAANIQSHLALLAELTGKTPAGRALALVYDLIANADRCENRGRFDDAVARLYRATEALAQGKLFERGIDTSQPDLALISKQLPPEKRDYWQTRLGRGGRDANLGLGDAYRLLQDLGDPAGAKFFRLRLHRGDGPLKSRNNSILAHGFSPVDNQAYGSLRGKLLSLAGVEPVALRRYEFSLLPADAAFLAETVGGLGKSG